MILLIIPNVKATVVSSTLPYTSVNILNGDNETSVSFNTNSNVFNGGGEGYINFTLVQLSDLPNYPLRAIEAKIAPTGSTTVSEIYNCNYGTFSAYRDSTEQYIVYNVQCPVNIPSGKRLLTITISRVSNQNTGYYYFNDIVTFTNNSNESQAIIEANNSAIQSQINNENANAQAIQNNITSNVQNIISNIQSQQQQEQTNWNNFNNQDARQGDGDSSRPDDQVVDDTIDAEQDLIETVQNTLDPIQQVIITIDDFENAFEWIWSVIDEAFNSHLIVFTGLITTLGIGLIKLVLCR